MAADNFSAVAEVEVPATESPSSIQVTYDGETNEVTFRQNINDPQSVKPFREVTKQLNATVKQ